MQENTGFQGTAKPLYTSDERARRDATRWTLVQGVLAPLQFLVFLVSLALVLRYLHTGAGETAATASIVIKTDRKSTRLNSSHVSESRMPSSA